MGAHRSPDSGWRDIGQAGVAMAISTAVVVAGVLTAQALGPEDEPGAGGALVLSPTTAVVASETPTTSVSATEVPTTASTTPSTPASLASVATEPVEEPETATPTPWTSSTVRPEPLTVYNATQQSGLAHRAAKRFEAAGWPVPRVSSITADVDRTTVFYDPADKEVAIALVSAFPTIADMQPRPSWLARTGTPIVVVTAEV